VGRPEGVSNRDDHLADWLVRGIGDVVRFDHSKQQWHVWNGYIWAPDKTNLIFDKVREEALTLIAGSQGDEGKDFLTLLNTQKKNTVLKAMASRPEIAMDGREWDPDPFLMAFTNGVLDLRTLAFDPSPSPSLLLSRSTRQPWDPEADMEPFATFLRQIMGDDIELTEYLMRVLGYSMIGFQREQKFWMWVGPGQNGKGVLAKVVAAALGDYGDSPSAELYMRNRFGAAPSSAARPDLLRLQGVRFTWMSEPHGGHFNDELLKAHTGDDPITARDLYGKAASTTTFRPTHTVNFLTNDPPKTDDAGPSMRRRARIIRFEQDFTGSRDDKGLEDRLKQPENLQGVLRLLAIGANEYFRFGLVEPAKVTEWSESYIQENDPLSGFIVEACLVGSAFRSPAAILWDAYRDWCAQKGTDPGSQTGFGMSLGRKFRKEKTMHGTVYVGIKARSVVDAADDD
jgi:putative DNA primase/helicase